MRPFIERLSFLEKFCLKNIKSFTHQRNWLREWGVQTPWTVCGCKKSNDTFCATGYRLV